MDNQEESLRNSSSCTALLDSVHVSISNGKMLTKNMTIGKVKLLAAESQKNTVDLL